MPLLRLLLDPGVFRGILWFLVLATPVAGAAWAVRAARRATLPPRQPLFWLLAASGPIVGVLWMLFNAIVNVRGLDSIPGDLAAVGVFCVLGFGLSLYLRYGRRRQVQRSGKR